MAWVIVAVDFSVSGVGVSARTSTCLLTPLHSRFYVSILQEACPLVVPRLVTKSEGNRSSAVELSAKRSAIQYIASASSSARETSQSSDPPGYIFFDNLYAQALQPIWAAPDPDPDPEENRADAGSGFETSGSPAVAKLRLKHVAERARLLFGRYVGDEVHDNAPREGHCVPVPHMHQIQRIHPLQEVGHWLACSILSCGRYLRALFDSGLASTHCCWFDAALQVRFLELGTSGLLLGTVC